MKFKELHKNIKIRVAVQFISTLASMMVIPYLPIYFSKLVGEAATGIMFMIVIVSGVVGGIIGGFYSDKIGRKKLMILSETVISLTFIAIACFNSTWFVLPYVSFVLFIINMFFSGLMMPAAQAMILDVTNSTSRKLVFAITYWASNLAMALSGIVGAFLFEDYIFQLFLLVAGVSLFSVCVTYFFIDETHVPNKTDDVEESPQKGGMLSSYVGVLKDKAFIFYVIACVLIMTIEQQLSNYIGVRMANEMTEQTLIPGLKVNGIEMLGILRSENTILVVALASLIGILSKKMTEKRSLFIGIAIFTLGFYVLSINLTPWILLIAVVILTVGELLHVPVKQAYMGDLAPSHSRSSYMAIYSISFQGGTILAALCISLSTVLSANMMGMLILVMGATSLILFQIIMPELMKRRELEEIKIEVKTETASV